jgi:hypothetical protein
LTGLVNQSIPRLSILAVMPEQHHASRPVTFAQRLCGRLTAIGPGLAELELTGDVPTLLEQRAHVVAKLSFVTERTIRARGTIEVAGRDVLAFSTARDGHLGEPSAGGDRHGTTVLEAIGHGPLAGTRWRITSTFVVSGDGRMTDHQFLVLFCRADHHQEETP